MMFKNVEEFEDYLRKEIGLQNIVGGGCSFHFEPLSRIVECVFTIQYNQGTQTKTIEVHIPNCDTGKAMKLYDLLKYIVHSQTGFHLKGKEV